MANNRTIPAITLTPDPEQIAKITKELAGIRDGVPRALAPAINKTLAKGQTELIRGLTEILTAKRANILGKKDKRRITVQKANPETLKGHIRIMARPIGLINFKIQDTRHQATRGVFGKRALKGLGAATGSGRGVVVQVRKNEAPRVLPKAFVAVGLSGNQHVFERFGVRRKQTKAHYLPNIGKMRQPIRSFKGESLLTVWRETPSLRGKVQGRIYQEFPRDIASQVDRLLKRTRT